MVDVQAILQGGPGAQGDPGAGGHRLCQGPLQCACTLMFCVSAICALQPAHTTQPCTPAARSRTCWLGSLQSPAPRPHAWLQAVQVLCAAPASLSLRRHHRGLASMARVLAAVSC